MNSEIIAGLGAMGAMNGIIIAYLRKIDKTIRQNHTLVNLHCRHHPEDKELLTLE